MSKKEGYEARIEEFLLLLMGGHEFELMDVEYVEEAGTRYLRAYIGKEDGTVVDSCEVISRKLNEWLDAEDSITDSYILEISSPGLGGPSRKDKDFERSVGRGVDIKLYRTADEQKGLTGILKSCDKVHITIEQEGNTEKVFTRSDIVLIRLVFDF